MEAKQKEKKHKISLCANIALAVVLVGLMIWTLIPGPKKAVMNVSIFIVGIETQIHIAAEDYESNLVADILKKNNSVLKIKSDELTSGFITEIAGITGDWSNGFWWFLEVNYEPADKGVNELTVSNGAVITFKLVDTSYNPWE